MLARALMPSPRYLLLDEPSAGLSPMMLEEVFAAISGIVEASGVAVLLVEQNAAEVSRSPAAPTSWFLVGWRCPAPRGTSLPMSRVGISTWAARPTEASGRIGMDRERRVGMV